MKNDEEVTFFNNPLLAAWQLAYRFIMATLILMLPFILAVNFAISIKKLREKKICKRERRYWKDFGRANFFGLWLVILIYIQPFSDFMSDKVHFVLNFVLGWPGIGPMLWSDPQYMNHFNIDDLMLPTIFLLLIPIAYYVFKLLIKLNGANDYSYTWISPAGYLTPEQIKFRTQEAPYEAACELRKTHYFNDPRWDPDSFNELSKEEQKTQIDEWQATMDKLDADCDACPRADSYYEI